MVFMRADHILLITAASKLFAMISCGRTLQTCDIGFFSRPGLRQHAIDIKEKKKNAICRTGHWDRSKQKVLKRVIQEEGESSRWSKKPFLERKIFFLAPPYPLLLLAPHLTPPCWKGSRWSFEESFSIPATLFSLAFSTREFYTHTEQTTAKGLLSRFNFPFC